jgi:hypothetical protein
MNTAAPRVGREPRSSPQGSWIAEPGSAGGARASDGFASAVSPPPRASADVGDSPTRKRRPATAGGTSAVVSRGTAEHRSRTIEHESSLAFLGLSRLRSRRARSRRRCVQGRCQGGRRPRERVLNAWANLPSPSRQRANRGSRAVLRAGLAAFRLGSDGIEFRWRRRRPRASPSTPVLRSTRTSAGGERCPGGQLPPAATGALADPRCCLRTRRLSRSWPGGARVVARRRIEVRVPRSPARVPRTSDSAIQGERTGAGRGWRTRRRRWACSGIRRRAPTRAGRRARANGVSLRAATGSAAAERLARARPGHDPGRDLIIDPSVDYSTFLGDRATNPRPPSPSIDRQRLRRGRDPVPGFPDNPAPSTSSWRYDNRPTSVAS